MNKYSVSLVPVVMFFFLTSSHKKTEQVRKNYDGIGLWTGTLTQDEVIIYSNAAYNGKSVRHVEVSFVNALPTMYRDDPTKDLNFTDDKGTGIHKLHSAVTDVTGRECVGDCSGVGQAELHSVVISESDSTYDIEAIGPDCKGTTCSEDGGVRPYEEGSMISVSNHKLTDKNVLSGSETVTSELPGGLGKATRITTWHLERDKEDDVELIVTPENYDNWLPEPGKNEMMKGSVMTINLKLQGKNGKPLKVKAESFELRLNNTSKEPGITINYPVEPDPKQLPDLRFLVLSNIESVDEDQFTSISSPDGITGKAYIGSYDGGGWTMLTAEAILKDGRHILGKLLASNGETDIRIPKREPNSKIGEVWLKKYDNPGEMDDKETSKDNNNKGDGLTAYEEYRGVISEGKFKRLDPQKKELGIKISQKDFSVFGEGIKWFESASGLKIIRFGLDEIGGDRRLNKNYMSAHDYDQFVIHLKQGNIFFQNLMGNCYCIYKHPDIPARVEKVIVDVFAITNVYNSWKASQPLPFTVNEKIANVVAHELCHAVNVWHHGDLLPYTTPFTITSRRDHVIAENGFEIAIRPYVVRGGIGPVGGLQSGDLSCVMAYNPYYSWCYKMTSSADKLVSEVPPINIGKSLCNSSKGTGINISTGMGNGVGISTTITSSSILNYQNDRFFGDATNGNCLSQIKLRE